MGRNDDWYRSPDWSPEAQQLFEQKLRRSRTSYHKAQYLKLKAGSLLRASDALARYGGYELLHRLVREYPNELSEVIEAHCDLGWAYAHDEDFAEAEFHYLESMRLNMVYPNLTLLTEILFAEMIIKSARPEKYGIALEYLDRLYNRRGKSGLLSSERFRYCVAYARLLARTGLFAEAAEFAVAAIRLSQITRPEFPRHPTFGLVQTTPDTLHEMQLMVELYGSIEGTEPPG